MLRTLLRALCPCAVVVCVLAFPGLVRGQSGQTRLRGDANCDGVLNNFDIDAFMLALLTPATYQFRYPACAIASWDLDGDGRVTNLDINGFVANLFGGNPWPSSDSQIACLSLLQAYTNVASWRDSNLVHSVQIPLPNANPAGHWATTVQNIQSASPGILWGTYISGTALRRAANMRGYPPEALPYESAPQSYTLGPYSTSSDRAEINLTIPAARTWMADAIVAEASARNAPLVFLDNMSHPSVGGTRATWPEVCDYLRSIRSRLNARGSLVMANLACQPYDLAGTDATLLATALDGVTFEQPFHWTVVRPFADRVVTELGVYEQLLNSGMHVALQAAWSDIVYDEVRSAQEERVLAAMCMMIHRPGVSLQITRNAYNAPPDWAYWPVTFGPARGPYTLVSSIGPILRREFQHATVTVNLALSTNALTAGSAVTIQTR